MCCVEKTLIILWYDQVLQANMWQRIGKACDSKTNVGCECAFDGNSILDNRRKPYTLQRIKRIFDEAKPGPQLAYSFLSISIKLNVFSSE